MNAKRMTGQMFVLFTCCLLPPAALPGAQVRETGLGLPHLVTKDDSRAPAKAALGKQLFFDKRLSRDGTISCASCHQPEKAFTDGLTVAKGIGQQAGTRNTPSLLNVAFNQSQFWDGRRATLESQALDPFVNVREHGLRDHQKLLGKMIGYAEYATAFQMSFGNARGNISLNNLAEALASFQRTLLAGDSKFDRYLFGNEKTALTESAVRGLALFQGTARCASCHLIGKNDALFSDNQFHSLGIGLPRLGPRLAELTTRLVRANEGGNSLDHEILGDDTVAELGRFAVTFNPADIAKFRTPSLRNVARTAPYMHDGSVATLEEAVDIELYYRGVQADRPLILTPSEKMDLVEFLRSLSSAAPR